MSRTLRNVFISNAPERSLGFGFLPSRRYRDDFAIDEAPLDLPSTARKVEDDDDNKVLRTMSNQDDDFDDDDDVVPFANQYDDYDDFEDLDLPSTASKKVRMREILANECCGDDDNEPLYIPSTERD